MADLETKIENRVATLTINRPEARNAVTSGMWAEIRDHLQAFADNDDVGVVVLTGAGDKAFSAGGDVKDMAARLTNPEPQKIDEQIAYIQEIVAASRLLHTMPKVTIGAINGAAAGAGLSLALACDLRIMVDDAKLTTAFANIALSGDFGGGYFLSQLVGQAKARELFYLAPTLTGAEAAEMGVVNKAVARADFAGALDQIAQQIANGPTSVFTSMKANFHLAETANLDEYLKIEAERMARSFHSEDHREAALAFVAKRKPVFKGR
jgi:2-(1,2-epoxy-1,2-dihydrophenyl)acetyl-CoA isomerase